MTIRHLTIFLAVAEYGTMSAAAEHLYLSQPTISQAIRELEKHYNGLLFERLGKKLYLSDRGTLLLPQARELGEPVHRSGRTDVEPGADFHSEAWKHTDRRNLSDSHRYAETGRIHPRSGSPFLCKQYLRD